MLQPEISRLYKYQALNAYSLAMLVNRKMWLSKPEKFNDPFDCALTPGLAKTSEDSQHQLFQVIDELYCPKEADAVKAGMMGKNQIKPTTEDNDERVETHIAEAREMGIFSLSSTWSNILMWSHYANNHTGFCVGFERANAEENFLSHHMCRPVHYTDKYPNLNRVVHLSDVNLYTKAEDWKYEKEWRLVAKAGNQLLPLPAPIRSIIFGLKASPETIATVKNAVRDLDIEFSRAVQAPGRYALEYEAI